MTHAGKDTSSTAGAIRRCVGRLVRAFRKPEKEYYAITTQDRVWPERCEHCNRGWNSFPRHAIDCPKIDLETAKLYLKQVEHANERANAWILHYQRMEGRYHVLRHENNTLRHKLRKAGVIK